MQVTRHNGIVTHMAPAERGMKGSGNKLVNGWPSVLHRSFPFGGEKERCRGTPNANETAGNPGNLRRGPRNLPTFLLGWFFPTGIVSNFYSIPK